VSVVDRVHGGYVHGRRVRVLAGHLARLLPPDSEVLDVGCGDGLLAWLVARARPDVQVAGIDVLLRPEAHVPVSLFDGRRIPRPDRGVDVLTLVDVLHHTPDPTTLLREAARVARRAILIKDHLLSGPLAGPTLRLMDRVGNARHGVELPYNYWPPGRWSSAFAELGLAVEAWSSRLGLYPWPADYLFGRSLHFVARLAPATRRGV
jgi:SAM-dependent methyltransferase